MEKYIPAPLDTSHVLMPDDLNPLIEQLAANNHEEWALNRINQGWIWGPGRCDEKKHHPCLVSYQELSETEKEYDRIAAVSTIKVLLALGYQIIKI